MSRELASGKPVLFSVVTRDHNRANHRRRQQQRGHLKRQDILILVAIIGAIVLARKEID